MDIYHGFFDLDPGTSDTAFADDLAQFLDHLKEAGRIAGWRLMRRKLGLSPAGFGEFHLMIEVESLAQLDEAFGHVSTRTGEVEARHAAVNSKVAKIAFALYRDFPDPHRQRGEERF